MKKVDSINLVPFIDIMLVLLVIVLTVTSFTNNEQIKVDTPSIENNNLQQVNVDNISITLDKEGKIFIDQYEIKKDELKNYLSTLNRDKNIIINSDKKSNVEDFINIFSILQDLGFLKVFMQVKKNAQK